MVAEQPAAAGHTGPAAGAAEHDFIANVDDLEAYSRLPPAPRPPLHATHRGVLAETALSGLQRFEWRLLLPLLHSMLDSLFADFQEQADEVGPPRPMPPGFDSPADAAARLHGLLDGFAEAPFTLQRLCEVLCEPRKQYNRLDKVVAGVEKLLMVTSTRQPDPQDALPPRPALSSLVNVNSNPPSPYFDGRPPQVLDEQQHQAFLQQQAAAMAALQQQHGRQMGGMPNGLDERPQLEAQEGERHTASPAAADAMQVDVPPPAISAAEAASAAQFVDSALADAEAPGSPPAGGSRLVGSAATPPSQLLGSSQPQGPQQGQQYWQQQGALQPQLVDERGPNGAVAAAPAAGDGPSAMDVAPHSPSAAGDDIGQVIARLQQQLPQAVQAVLLPPLFQLQQQQRQPGGAGGTAQAGAAGGGASDGSPSAQYSLVAAALSKLPAGEAAAVLHQLQTVLPTHVMQQLLQPH